ncbi:MAG: BamA/TamA family outer membrane protein [bacterium]|nr:BamA/TamA family outer membrane protein [bacterium]
MLRSTNLHKSFTRSAARLAVAGCLAVGVLASASPVAAQFGKNKVRYENFEWQVYHSPHFDVYYYESEAPLLQKIVSYAESAYDELSVAFNFKIEEATPLIFYETHSDFEQTNIILNFIPEGIGAFASPVRNRMVLPVDLPGPELYELLLHELTHIFQYHMIFGGNLGKGVASAPPTWFMEGMASYMAHDESARDKMYLRDAVVNDRIPPVSQDFGGFFAYRFGHAVFDYIEEIYGKEGVRDFMIETRNTLGARTGRSVQRTFQVEPEDFDADFRRWLRKKYLPELIATGEPADFGRRFREKKGPIAVQASPAASPSGDLLVAFSTDGSAYSSVNSAQVDIVLYDARRREELRNLTKGFDEAEFQYFIAQELTMGRRMGRDLSFSPDGDRIAFFARRQKGRSLVVLDVLKGKITNVIDMDVEQQFAPAWSADGRTVAFSGHQGGQFDIFEINVDTGEVAKLTNDAIFDAAPVYSPDGRSLVMTSVVGGYGKLFRVDLDSPTERFPLTDGQWNDTDAVYSADGNRVYFTSDRTEVNNIYSLDLASGEIKRHTNSVTGCFTPTLLANPDGTERLVFTAFWKGRFDLYLLDPEEPITEPEVIVKGGDFSVEGSIPEDLKQFEPPIEVTLDDRNKGKFGGRKFFIEDIGGTVGVSDDQTFIGASFIQLSDFLGDRRIIGAFQSIENFQNFDVIYANLSNRWNWQVHLFDDRDFFIGQDQRTGFLERGPTAFSQTGANFSLSYPINVSHRVSFGLGYTFRDIGFQTFLFDIDGQVIRDPETGEPVPLITPRKDDFPILSAGIVGDTVVLSPWGYVGGRRWNLSGSYAPDLDESGTLTSNLAVDYRQYFKLTRRSQLAFRGVAYASEGNFPNPFYFGGLDTVRGFDFRSLVGDRAFYTNFELRFPFLDRLSTPIFQGNVRGVFFLDIAGAWYDSVQSFKFLDEDDRLVDGVSSYGFGVTLRLFGLDFNIDWAKQWDFKDSEDGFDSSIWIGRRF